MHLRGIVISENNVYSVIAYGQTWCVWLQVVFEFLFLFLVK